MFEQLKQVLTIDYENELSRFDHLKRGIEKLEITMMNDNSEEEYKNSLSELDKKYGFFKKHSKEYKNELTNIQNDYNEKLKQFEEIYNHCVDLKNEAANINIYVIQKKKEQLMNATNLEDLRMTEEEAAQIIEEKQGVEPIIYNDNEIDDYLTNYDFKSNESLNFSDDTVSNENVENQNIDINNGFSEENNSNIENLF